MTDIHIGVQQEPFDLSAEMAALRHGRQDAGAAVSFTGTVRDTVGDLKSLTLEHYPGMTERELTQVAEEAMKRWPLLSLRVIHRYGPLTPGDHIVLVLTLSAHRHAAFEGAMYMMDHLKTRATFWKREDRTDGSGEWVDARESDDEALERWAKT